MPIASTDTDPDALRALAERALKRLRAASPQAAEQLSDPDGEAAQRCRQVAIASDFAIDTLVRQPERLVALLVDPDAGPVPPPVLDLDASEQWPALLRRYRAAESARLVWRDVLGLDDVDATLAGSTALAERCLELGLAALEAEMAQRHGVVRDGAGGAQRLVVFGLGKLGGAELNFSSDVDLVYAYPSADDAGEGRAMFDLDESSPRGELDLRILVDGVEGHDAGVVGAAGEGGGQQQEGAQEAEHGPAEFRGY
ncbi:MAG: hypothetical protein KY442_08470 [Proteobacteria bacterium]|nr:hypothetical protein [Pseudomonadota bacterium]